MDSYFKKMLGTEEKVKRLSKIEEVAKELGYSQAQLAIAWILANKDVSTCITINAFLEYARFHQVRANR
jgi:aryl-alcohol dehydrogenase-like predicted oxidoreductase